MGKVKGLPALVDVIIVCYRSASTLNRLLISFEVHERRRESCLVHVVNNGATDARLSRWSEEKRFRLYQSRKNLGYARAVNGVLKQTSAPYVMLLNPDVYFTMPLVDKMYSLMEAHSQVGILGPKILNEDGSLQGSARSFPSWTTALFGRSSMATRLFPGNALTRANVLDEPLCRRDGCSEVDWVSGACLFVRRKAIEDVGGMDERFFLYWEDADWCRRMWNEGWKVMYWPHVHVVHTGGVSSRQRAVSSAVAFHRSALHYYVKHRPPQQQWLDLLVAWGLGLRLLGVLGLRLLGGSVPDRGHRHGKGLS